MTGKINEYAKMIDHSLLHPTLTDKELKAGCMTALKYNCASVCIKPYAVKEAASFLRGSGVLTGTVIGFPHGNSCIDIKMKEALSACHDGASEIDMVINIGKALGNDWGYLKEEISSINSIVIDQGGILKVIFETDYLGDDPIIRLCEICSKVGVAFVKTSSGYGFVKQDNGFYSYQGATEHNLKLMRKYSAPEVQVKAAGGVKTLSDLIKVKQWGVSRVGATATAAILDEAKKILENGQELR